MTRIEFAETAKADLDEIWLYIAQDNLTAADALLERIGRAVLGLRDFPETGIARPELAPGLRNLVIGNYLVFYRPRTSVVMIERVLHGRREIKPALF